MYPSIILKSNIGGHLSILVTLPNSIVVEAYLPGQEQPHHPLHRLHLVEAPEEAQTFETARVMVIQPAAPEGEVEP